MDAPTTDTRTMSAWVQDRYGPLEAVVLRQVPRPSPGPGEVLIRVLAAGVDPSIWHLMTGTPYLVRLAMGVRGPRVPIPGQDAAGTVVELGEGVSGLEIGQRVFGAVRGSFAGYAPARVDNLVALPEEVSFESAATLPTSAVTALQAVRAAKVRPGDRVAVLGAGGGVGSYAVQLAVRAGARVTGVCSARKVELVRSLGAAEVIDYTVRDVTDRADRYDVLIDTAGNRSLIRLRTVLTDRGRLVIVGGESARPQPFGVGRPLRAGLISPFIGQRLTGLLARVRHEDLRELSDLLAGGELVAPIARTYRLDEAMQAVQDVRAGEIAGKAVILPG